MKTYSSVLRDEEKKIINCNLCGSGENRTYLACPGFAFVRCCCCGLVFQNPQPVFDELKKRYAKEYFEYEIGNEENFFNLMKLGLSDINFDSLTSNLPKQRRFLDIGCATGILLAYMRDKGWNVNGSDICADSAGYGIKNRGIDIFIGPVDQAGYKDNFFDVIHFSHLIEHVPDPSAFFKEIKRILMPGGIIIVTTPNVKGFQARLFGKNWRSAIADHLYLFDKKTLGSLLSQYEFSIEKLVTWGGLAAGLVPSFMKKPVDRLAKKWGFGDVMLFLARKPAGN